MPTRFLAYQAAIRAGAYPQVQFLSETLRHSLLKYGNTEQLSWVPEIEAYGMEWADVYIGLRGAFNLHIHAQIPAERLSINQAAMGKINEIILDQHLRTCVTTAIRGDEPERREAVISEILEVFRHN